MERRLNPSSAFWADFKDESFAETSRIPVLTRLFEQPAASKRLKNIICVQANHSEMIKKVMFPKAYRLEIPKIFDEMIIVHLFESVRLKVFTLLQLYTMSFCFSCL